MFRFPTDPNLSVCVSCVHNNHRQSDQISEDISTRNNTGQNNQMQGNAQPAVFTWEANLFASPDLWRYLIRPESNGDSEELQPCRININSFCQQSDSLACCFATLTRFIVRETPPRFLYVCIWNPSFYPIVSQRIGTLSKPSEGLFDRHGIEPHLNSESFASGNHAE